MHLYKQAKLLSLFTFFPDDLVSNYQSKVALSYVAVAVGKIFVACFHLGNFSCVRATSQVVVVAKVEVGATLTIQSCSFTS